MNVSQTHILTLVLCFFLFSSVSFGQVDSIELHLFKSIRSYQQQDSFVTYIKTIEKVKNYYYEIYKKEKNKGSAFKKRCKRMVDLCDRFTIYREPVNDEEKNLTRWYYATKLYWTRKTYNDDSKNLPIGLKGAEYAVDPILLDEHAFTIEMQIGNSYARQLDDSRAILYYNKCLPYLENTKNYEYLSSLCANIGSAYTRLGDYENARNYFNRGVNASKKIDCLDCFLANHTRLRDLAYDENNKSLFLQLADEHKLMLSKHRNDPKIQSRITDLNNSLGKYYFNEKEYEKALPYFLQVQTFNLGLESSMPKRNMAKNSAKIAQCYMVLDDTNSFRQEIKFCNENLFSDFNDLCPPDSLLYAENTFIEVYDITSDFFVKEFHRTNDITQLDTALLFLQKVLKVSQLLDQRILYSDSKSQFANEAREYVNKAVEIAYQIQDARGASPSLTGIARTLFNASKDQILKDKIDLQTKINLLKSDDKKVVDSLLAFIVSELASKERNSNKILQCQDEIDKITGSDANSNTQTELLGDYLEYVVTPQHIFLLSRIDAKMAFQKLGKKDHFDALLDEFNAQIKSISSAENTVDIFEQLGAFLIPNEIQLSASFTIIPDQKIATIPFDLLKLNENFLVEKHITSFQTHYFQKTETETENKSKIVCLNPEYPFQKGRAKDAVDRSGFYPLPFAKSEIKNIKSLFTSLVDVIQADSTESISEKLKGANVFHFAGHAKVNRDSAYLVLHNSKGIQKWTYDEIYPNNFDLSLVTLSACETGLGEVQYGDGLNSMARSFLGAGADAVVYSLWTVNDMSTSTIMNDFYAELKNGATKDEALRTAKLNYLATANPDRRDPYYWGGFVAAGNMSPIYFTTPTSYTTIIFSALGIILVGAILLKTLKTKHL